MMINDKIGWIKKNKSKTFLFLILLLGLILRFYDFGTRWGLAYDQARDLIVANYAIHNFKIPLIGPFTSAGAFVYGPQWFWILMILEILSFGTIIGPWIWMGLLSVFSIYIIYLIGKEIEGTTLGLIAAFITAISNMQITQSTNLTSPSMVGVFAIITCYFFIRYIKYSKKLDAFLLGFFISTSVNIHFQAIGLFTLVLIALFFAKRKISNILLLFFGLFIPFIPLLIFDLKTNFYESRNILDYYLHGQYRIYVPNRWLTYAFSYWPQMWGKIVGGYFLFGYFFLAAIFTVLFDTFIKKQKTKYILAFFIAFALIFIILRYYRGARFDSYLVFVHPFIFILSAWVLLRIYKFQKTIFYILLCLIFIGSMSLNLNDISHATNQTTINIHKWKNALIKTIPNKKIALYDYRFKTTGQSYPLIMLLENSGLLADNGEKVGFLVATEGSDFSYFPSYFGTKGGYQLLGLNSSTSAELAKAEWAFINPSAVYESVEEWYINK